jgi:hypothetical protein
MRILVTLPSDRLLLGQWFLEDDDGVTILGPFPCDGKSDNAAAALHGNPSRDPAKPFGDTPLGEYSATLGYIYDSPDDRRSYGLPDKSGMIPVIWLKPLLGYTQAWARQTNEGLTVNLGLAIHTGPPNGNNELRPTHGCCRTWQQDFTPVYAYLDSHLAVPHPSFSVSIEEKIPT